MFDSIFEKIVYIYIIYLIFLFYSPCLFISLVVSTTEPGRKPSDIGENGDETMNGDILSAISVGIETTKTILKCDGELNTNGNLKIEKDNGTISDVPIDEVASSSGVTKSDNADAVTVAEPPKDQPTVESIEKDSAEEKSISDKPTIDDTPKMDVEPAVDVSSSGVPTSDNAEVTVTVAITVAEPSKDQPTVESSKKDSADEKSISDKPTVDDKPKVDVEPAVVDKSQVEKEDIPVAKEESSEAIMKEIPPAENIVEPSTDAKVEPLSPVKEPVIIDKPPTPKRACSDDEDDPIQNGCAKKIKLEEPQPEVSKVDSKEKSEASADDKAKKEDVVDSALPAEQEKVVDSSTDNSPAECVIEKEPIEKALEPVVEDEPQASIDSITPVSSELIVDYTPDEALNELVSSDLANDLAPTEPIAEEKLPESTDNNINITEPIVTTPATPVDMNIEENETVAPAAAIPDTAMEAAPIKADEEMDVDESNSADADAMDL